MTIITMGAGLAQFDRKKNKTWVIVPAGLKCSCGQTFTDQEPEGGLPEALVTMPTITLPVDAC